MSLDAVQKPEDTLIRMSEPAKSAKLMLHNRISKILIADHSFNNFIPQLIRISKRKQNSPSKQNLKPCGFQMSLSSLADSHLPSFLPDWQKKNIITAKNICQNAELV
jgi:hypothetical protein